MARKDAGFTLIEMLITLAIIAVTITIGVPTFKQTLQHYRVVTTMHLITSDLALARNAAIMRRSRVVVCPRTTDLRCRTDADWSNGWIVFIDRRGNRQPDASENILSVGGAKISAQVSIRASRGFLRYQSDGRSAHSNQTIRICTGGALAGEIVINNVGRVRSARPTGPTPCPHA